MNLIYLWQNFCLHFIDFLVTFNEFKGFLIMMYLSMLIHTMIIIVTNPNRPPLNPYKLHPLFN